MHACSCRQDTEHPMLRFWGRKKSSRQPEAQYSTRDDGAAFTEGLGGRISPIDTDGIAVRSVTADMIVAEPSAIGEALTPLRLPRLVMSPAPVHIPTNATPRRIPYTASIAPPAMPMPQAVDVLVQEEVPVVVTNEPAPKLGGSSKWRNLLKSSLSILDAEQVPIKVKRKLGFRSAGFMQKDNPTAKALTQMRMYGIGETVQFNSAICVSNDNSYPFHMLAVLSLANGDVFRESTFNAFQKFDETWTKTKVDAVEAYDEETLKILLPNVLAKHAEDAPRVYRNLLLISSHAGMEESKMACFIGWVGEVDGLMYSTFKEMKMKKYIDELKEAIIDGKKTAKLKRITAAEADPEYPDSD